MNALGAAVVQELTVYGNRQGPGEKTSSERVAQHEKLGMQ